jgi:hypothetical protein
MYRGILYNVIHVRTYISHVSTIMWTVLYSTVVRYIAPGMHRYVGGPARCRQIINQIMHMCT